jgi:hypothetical protein
MHTKTAALFWLSKDVRLLVGCDGVSLVTLLATADTLSDMSVLTS